MRYPPLVSIVLGYAALIGSGVLFLAGHQGWLALNLLGVGLLVYSAVDALRAIKDEDAE